MSYVQVTDEEVRRRGKLWGIAAAVAVVLNLLILGWLLWMICDWCAVCTLPVGILIARYAKRDLGLSSSGAGSWLKSKFIPICSGFWLQRAKRVPLHKRRREVDVAVAAVVTLLLIASWIAYRDSRPASPLGTSALQRSNAIEQQVPFVPAKRVSGSGTSEQQVPFVPAKQVLANSTSKSQTGGRRVRLGDNQVEYIGDDVTVHYFTPKHSVAPQQPVGSPAQPVDRFGSATPQALVPGRDGLPPVRF